MTMKKTYQRPAVRVKEMRTEDALLLGSYVIYVSGEGISYGGGGTGARSRQTYWDEDEDYVWDHW